MPDEGPRGRGFKSRLLDQTTPHAKAWGGFVLNGIETGFEGGALQLTALWAVSCNATAELVARRVRRALPPHEAFAEGKDASPVAGFNTLDFVVRDPSESGSRVSLCRFGSG